MLAAVTTGVTTAITYVGDVLSAITGQSGVLADVLPLIGLAVN